MDGARSNKMEICLIMRKNYFVNVPGRTRISRTRYEYHTHSYDTHIYCEACKKEAWVWLEGEAFLIECGHCENTIHPADFEEVATPLRMKWRYIYKEKREGSS